MIAYNNTQLQLRSSLLFGIIIVGYFVLSPLYIFPSGLPQPADLLMILGVGFMLSAVLNAQQYKLPSTYMWGVAFVVYVAIINILNFYHDKDDRFIFATLFYAYNLMAFILVAELFTRYTHQMQRWSYRAIVAALVMQIIAMNFLGGEWGRAEGTFNNPNQLSYWALLCGLILIILKKRDGLNMRDLAVLLLIGYIQTQALSKAGILVYIALMGGLVFTPLLTKKIKLGLLLLCVLVGGFLTAQPQKLQIITQLKVLDRAITRIESIGEENDDSLEGRGYNRLWKFPTYTILGTGEGAHYRFTYNRRNKEIHSGIATLIFSYGIVGVLLFTAFMLAIFNKKSWYLLFFFAIIMAYGATHQNIRFTHFWIVLALCHISPRLVSFAPLAHTLEDTPPQ